MLSIDTLREQIEPEDRPNLCDDTKISIKDLRTYNNDRAVLTRRWQNYQTVAKQPTNCYTPNKESKKACVATLGSTTPSAPTSASGFSLTSRSLDARIPSAASVSRIPIVCRACEGPKRWKESYCLLFASSSHSRSLLQKSQICTLTTSVRLCTFRDNETNA